MHCFKVGWAAVRDACQAVVSWQRKTLIRWHQKMEGRIFYGNASGEETGRAGPRHI